MDHVTVARAKQMEILARMTPDQRFRLAGQVTEMALGLREQSRRRLHPHADAAELRRIRVRDVQSWYDANGPH